MEVGAMPDCGTPAFDFAEHYAIGIEQIALYREQGHLMLRGVAPEGWMAYYRRRLHALFERLDRQRLGKYAREDFGGRFWELTNLWTLDEQVKRLTCAPRFARLAAELLQAPVVRLHYDCILFKGPGGGPTPWHQDQAAWPLDTDKTITMWMPLSDLPAEIGSLTFVSGSHRLGEATLLQSVRSGLKETEYGAMRAGDATFHGGWTLHSARANPTDRMRDAFAVIYYADGARLTDPGDNLPGVNHMRTFFPGLQPGDEAASELNPVVYGG